MGEVRDEEVGGGGVRSMVVKFSGGYCMLWNMK